MLIMILLTVGVMILSVQHDSVDFVTMFKCVLILESTLFRQDYPDRWLTLSCRDLSGSVRGVALAGHWTNSRPLDGL
jgi:hypothetical protein